MVVLSLSCLCGFSLPFLLSACKSIMHSSVWVGGKGQPFVTPQFMIMIKFTATVLSHMLLPQKFVSPRGKRCPLILFVFWCVVTLVWCLLPLFVVLLRVAVWKNFRSELLFLGVSLGLGFSVVLCLGFCFMCGRFATETVWKNSLNVRSCVSGIVLSFLGFPSMSFLFFFRFQERKIR